MVVDLRPRARSDLARSPLCLAAGRLLNRSAVVDFPRLRTDASIAKHNPTRSDPAPLTGADAYVREWAPREG